MSERSSRQAFDSLDLRGYMEEVAVLHPEFTEHELNCAWFCPEDEQNYELKHPTPGNGFYIATSRPLMPRSYSRKHYIRVLPDGYSGLGRVSSWENGEKPVVINPSIDLPAAKQLLLPEDSPLLLGDIARFAKTLIKNWEESLVEED